MRPVQWFPVMVLALAAGACAGSTPSAETAPRVEETFSANYTNIGNVGATGATPVTIRIRRWTTDEEQQRLMEVLSKKQTEGFVEELRRMKEAGSIGVPQELAYPLLYARQVRTKDGGRHITLASDRPMTFEERVSASVSRDYPLTWIELHLDAKDQGTGTMALAVRLRLVGDILGIEDLSTQPARLTDIKKAR